MNAICENTKIQASEEDVMFERLPSAWYDLSCRLDTIRAVTQSLPDTVDFICSEGFEDSEEERRFRLNQISGLADAVLVLLDLATADAARLERELESRVR